MRALHSCSSLYMSVMCDVLGAKVYMHALSSFAASGQLYCFYCSFKYISPNHHRYESPVSCINANMVVHVLCLLKLQYCIHCIKLLRTMRIAGETEPLISASPQELPVWAIAVGASVGACVLLALGVAIVVVTVVCNRRRAFSPRRTFSPREDSDEEIGKASQALCIDWMCDNRQCHVLRCGSAWCVIRVHGSLSQCACAF